MAATEAIMGTRAYWNDEPRQARYLDLLTRREALAAEREPEAAEENPIGIADRSAFLAACPGGDYSAYLDTMRGVGDVWLRVPDEEQGGLLASFNALPDTLVAGMVGEMQDRTYAPADAMDENTFADFKTGQGSVIVAEWGGEAADKIARVRGRLWRLVDGLETDADASAFGEWLAGLSPSAAAAVFRKLSI